MDFATEKWMALNYRKQLRYILQGWMIQDFFLGGGALVSSCLLLYFNTNKPHSFLFFAEYQLY